MLRACRAPSRTECPPKERGIRCGRRAQRRLPGGCHDSPPLASSTRTESREPVPASAGSAWDGGHVTAGLAARKGKLRQRTVRVERVLRGFGRRAGSIEPINVRSRCASRAGRCLPDKHHRVGTSVCLPGSPEWTTRRLRFRPGLVNQHWKQLPELCRSNRCQTPRSPWAVDCGR